MAYQSIPPSMTVCQSLSVPVRLENQGLLNWEVGRYNLSYHWLDPNGKVVRFEGIRTGLTSGVPPQGAQMLQATIQAPSNPGQYGLVWDMVEGEGVWFSLKNASYSQIPVQVNDLEPDQKALACGQALATNGDLGRPFPAELPTAPNQPDRQVLWGAAFKMILAHPLFGVGPEGFRLNYGAFVSPVQASWNKSIYANNLVLEILADLGLVGGGIFLALVVMQGRWLLLALVKPINLLVGWQVALVGAHAAFFVHSLLDYILGAHSINLLFWILLGLAGLYSQTGQQLRK